jgi:predicted nuclease of predicted toxin-antitoxin system
MRFLIDENLSVWLVDEAHSAGYEAYHVAHRGWSGLPDPTIFAKALDENLILVTNNRADYAALVGGTDLHPGLVVILENVRRDRQIAFFRSAIALIAQVGDMINRVVEVDREGKARVYDLPDLS